MKFSKTNIYFSTKYLQSTVYYGYVLEIMCVRSLRVHVHRSCMNRHAHWDGLILFWKVDLNVHGQYDNIVMYIPWLTVVQSSQVPLHHKHQVHVPRLDLED